MSVPVELGVKAYKYNGQYREFIGWTRGKKEKNLSCGAYSFSNIYSANMFSYLFRKEGMITAKKTVVAFEKKINTSVAEASFKEIIGLVDWQTLVTGNVPAAVAGTIKNGVKKICSATIGRVTIAGLVATTPTRHNRFTPPSDEFIQYALRYWEKHPLQGPSYMLQRDTVRPR